MKPSRPQTFRLVSTRCFALICVGCLAACDAIAPATQAASTLDVPAEFDSYALARAMAEDGKLDVAIVNYERVLEDFPSGKDGADVRLEYATVLLHADRPVRAREVLKEATTLSRSRRVRGRAAVLNAIVDHSEVETYLATNPPYETGRDRGRAVYGVMVEVYEKHRQYDEDGVIPARIRVLRESLARLEIQQMNTERERGDKVTASQRAQYIQLEFGDTQLVQQYARLLQTTALLG